MITAVEEECQCLAGLSRVGNLAACSHIPVKPLLPMHNVAKIEIEPFPPSGPPNFQNVGAPISTGREINREGNWDTR